MNIEIGAEIIPDRQPPAGNPDDLAEALAAGAGGRLTVNLGALKANWRDLAARSAPARTAGVVKADGYGLGIAHVVPALYQAGCRDFFVALVAEGLAARPFAPDARIFVLNGYFPGSAPVYREAGLIPVAGSLGQIAAWRAEGGGLPFALQVDTGMNRLGLSPDEALAYAATMRTGEVQQPVLLMTHLACGDAPEHPQNRRQLEAFRAVRAAFEGIESSIANSAGVFLGPEFHPDLTRPGIALYGGEAVSGTANPMRPVVTLEGHVVAVRAVPKGDPVGYGAAVTLARDSIIATCSVGYADGYPRAGSGAGVPLRNAVSAGGLAFAAGSRVPLVGRVTMDLTMFDVTDCGPGAVRPGDYLELIGPNMPLDEVARAAGTIGYEILTSLGRRYVRHYIGGAGG